MVAERTHPRVLRELTDVIARPLLIVFDQSWQLGEVSKDWRKANVIAIFKNGKKGNPGNYKMVSLTWIPRKVMYQLILESIYSHIKEKKIIRRRQHGFTKG